MVLHPGEKPAVLLLNVGIPLLYTIHRLHRPSKASAICSFLALRLRVGCNFVSSLTDHWLLIKDLDLRRRAFKMNA